MVADQVFLWHLPVVHDVNGSYQSQVTACQGHTPWTLWYTCLIPILVCIFHLSSGTHVLSYGTTLTNTQLCFGAGGMRPALVHIFHLMAQDLLTLGCALESLYTHIYRS